MSVGRLEDQSTRRALWLSACTSIGRAPSCALHLDHRSVSGHHAEISWDGRMWKLRDLGSRNGTFVRAEGQEPRRLDHGEELELALGVELGFASSTTIFRVSDLSAPCLLARAEDGEVRSASDDILCLPSDELLEVTIFCEVDGRWMLEDGGGQRPLSSHERVRAGGRDWEVSVPGSLPDTYEISHQPGVHTSLFRFAVSRDGEHVELRVIEGPTTVEIEARSHLALLLTLARVRLAEAANAELPRSEHGWVYREELERMLGVDTSAINLWIHRARKQLAAHGIRDAALVIERRAGVAQLRIGAAKLEIADA